MPVKKLMDAVIFGLGASAGQRAYEELEQKVEKALGLEEKPEAKPETPAEREKAEKEAKKARAREEREVDKELEALKKRIGK